MHVLVGYFISVIANKFSSCIINNYYFQYACHTVYLIVNGNLNLLFCWGLVCLVGKPSSSYCVFRARFYTNCWGCCRSFITLLSTLPLGSSVNFRSFTKVLYTCPRVSLFGLPLLNTRPKYMLKFAFSLLSLNPHTLVAEVAAKSLLHFESSWIAFEVGA